MKIGMVCPYDIGSPGGVQQQTTELAEQLRLLGDEVSLVAAGATDFSRSPGLDKSVMSVGRSVFLKGNESTVPLTLSPLSWSRVRSALADVDLIHVHEPMIPLVGWTALSVSKPTVATFHADPPGWVRTAYRSLPLAGPRMRRSLLTAVSDAAAAAVPADWGPVSIVPNAIDVASYELDVRRVTSRVAFLGRDEPRKGLDLLLGAWPEVRKAVPDAELEVMGASRIGGPEGVTYHGRVSAGEKKRLLRSSAVFVAPNTGGESFGIVVIEGLAAGCAVVVSDIPPFLAVMGDAGRSFPSGDTRSLARTIVGLLEDDAARADLALKGSERVTRFDWSVVVQEYRDLYRRLSA